MFFALSLFYSFYDRGEDIDTLARRLFELGMSIFPPRAIDACEDFVQASVTVKFQAALY
jgi:hypothetical protein